MLALVFHREDGYLTKAPKQREPHPTWPSRSHLERVFLQHVWNGYLRLTEVNLLLGVNKVIWDPDVGHILVTHEGICSNLSCLPGVGFSFRVDG